MTPNLALPPVAQFWPVLPGLPTVAATTLPQCREIQHRTALTVGSAPTAVMYRPFPPAHRGENQQPVKPATDREYPAISAARRVTLQRSASPSRYPSFVNKEGQNQRLSTLLVKFYAAQWLTPFYRAVGPIKKIALGRLALLISLIFQGFYRRM